MFGALGFLEVEHTVLAARLGASYRSNPRVVAGQQVYGLRLINGYAELCTRRWLLAASIYWQPCGTFVLGQLEAEAQQGFSSKAPPQQSVWATAGGALRASWQLMRGLSWELAVAVATPVSRDLRIQTEVAQGGSVVFYTPSPAGVLLDSSLRIDLF
jgi:hypothetical protein